MGRRPPIRQRSYTLSNTIETVGKLVGVGYDLVFGWWLDKISARNADKRLAEDVRTGLVLLFSERSAQVVANDESEYRESRSFDYAVVTVDMHLRFVRVRGDFSIYIALPGAGTRWESLDSILTSEEIQRGIRPTPDDHPHWGY